MKDSIKGRKYVGAVSIDYDQQGNPIKAQFIPAHNNVFRELKTPLKPLGQRTKEDVAEEASRVMAQWFTEVNLIELDEERDLTPGKCSVTKYDNGQIKRCTVKYYLTPKAQLN